MAGSQQREKHQNARSRANQSVDIFGPRLDRVETRVGVTAPSIDFVIIGRQLRFTRWRDELPKAFRPVRATHARTGCADDAAGQNDKINGNQGHDADTAETGA